MNKKTELIAFRCDDIIKTQLEEIATKERRSLSQIVNLIVEDYMLNNNGTIKPKLDI